MLFHKPWPWMLIVLLAGMFSACGILGNSEPVVSLDPAAPIMVLAGADATSTPTPFQPVPVTPVFYPTDIPAPTPPATPTPIPALEPSAEPVVVPEVDLDETRTWEDYPGPSVWPDVNLPAPAGLLAQPEDQVNILLLGSDQRPYDYGFRTDTMQLLTLTPSLGSVTLTSFPRDLYVYIPGWTMERMNTAFAYGGFDTLALTMEYNFGVRPDYYVMINLWSFVDVIDSLGGITVNVMNTLTDHRDNFGQFTIYAGNQQMNGTLALWYVRSRYSTSDFDRGRRQQEVLEGIFRKILSLDGISRASQLYELYRQNVETDMKFDEMAAFLPLAAQLDGESIRRYNIGSQEVVPIVNSYGAQVLLPIRESVLAMMRQALNTP